ncbi:uncharacterized protein LOC130718063 isoform X2 [Lotus japonicus]|uniref:uncharacterized protein LOC130718063 isoform X2 n=1 Tax=Lotus japonicus TaxID=34305 RepID=UPI002587B8D7|nr:uncharacterized protein LOC130718063 isoform X2 [Lotus japonicus]
MGSQIPRGNVNVPSGTNWTPAMENYFIGLLLDQVHKGNKVSYTFNKQAWNEMLALFNANFRSPPHDVNLLKNRYTTLSMKFNDIKNLLDRNGFSWDETSRMVVASDRVWDAYIKVHPHAQAYRGKELVDIKDLCLVYAHERTDGRYSLSSHDVDFGDDEQVVNTGSGREGVYHSSDGDEYVRGSWTLLMDCYLTDLLLNQALKVNNSSHDFTFEAWCDIVTSFCVKFGSHYTKEDLKNRQKYLEKHFDDLKVLTKQSGFAWDGKQEMVMAEDEVWNSYTKVHPDALLYRNKFVPIYHKLSLIYGGEFSEERCSHSCCSIDHICNGPISTIVDEDIQDCAIDYFSRVDGTPYMDRYLIDLMVEEVRRRNKIDYVRNDQACLDMVVMFKERFGIQFDKNYLKHCCKGLEKLYHKMRSLLEERGFSWDETRQMITACNGVWDAYIKEHPDANSYRNHQKPNYNDLCLIYGSSDTELTCNPANQNVGYNDCSIICQKLHWRSNWTPPMDRYFMDLMLEEVRNGSMVDHKFDRLTWRDMVAKFSAEFGSQYDENALQSQYMTLRKRFNDMKTLLNQRGFAWDEMQQMIRADERLWDSYVKVHPAMNAYCNRTLPSFNDLFLIYENTNCGRNEHYSGFSRGSLDNGLSTDVWEYNHSPPSVEPMRMAWTMQMNRYLISLLLDQLNRGNKIGVTFSKKAWSRMTASFNREFGLLCDRDALENQYLGLVRVYRDVTYLLNQNGIAWGKIQHTSRGNDVWQSYFQEHPDAISFEETILKNHSDLCLLFGTPKQNGMQGCLRIKLKTNNNNFGMENQEMVGGLQSSAREFKISNGRKRRKSEAALTSSNARKVQKTSLGEMQEDLEVQNDNSIESIVAALQTVPDLDDELFLEACLLLEDERKADMFVAMDSTARRRWLLKQLPQLQQSYC